MEKKFVIKDPDAPATHKQTWAIYCMAKKDVREMNLNRQQASDIIGALKNGDEVQWPDDSTSPAVENDKGKQNPAGIDVYRALLRNADEAGRAAADACIPTPMVVQQHANQLDDNSEVVKEWHVPSGVCGFAWLNFKANTPENRKFLKYLKKDGLAGGVNDRKEWSKDSYYGGYSWWVHGYGQSYELKNAYANAYANVLCNAGLSVYARGRLD